MNLSRKKYYLLVLAAAASFSALGDTTPPASAPAAEETSVFVQPENPQEGRDPFFPESTRPYASAVAAHAAPPVATLSIKGFSGTAEDRTVIINNHSFAAGDEGDVMTVAGRVHVRCLVIKDNSVIIEADHQRRELSFSTQ
jgi:hypothetical protein